MKVLQDNYLDQMVEEMELINFKLDRLFEAAVTVNEVPVDEDSFSLLESVDETPSPDIEILEEKYEVYLESVGGALKSIWRAIVRFIKSIFTSSGNRMTGKEAKSIIETLKSAADDGKMSSGSLKNAVQKGFYLIAGLGSSVNGVALKAAFDNGTTVNFVTDNINKVNVNKIPDDAKFRICIGTYESNIKTSMAVIGEIFSILSKQGIKGIEELGSKVRTGAKGVISKLKKDGKKNEAVDLMDEDATDDDLLGYIGMFENSPEATDSKQVEKDTTYQDPQGDQHPNTSYWRRTGERDKARAEAAKRRKAFQQSVQLNLKQNKKINELTADKERLEKNAKNMMDNISQLENLLGLKKNEVKMLMDKLDMTSSELASVLKQSNIDKSTIEQLRKDNRGLDAFVSELTAKLSKTKKLAVAGTVAGAAAGAAITLGAMALCRHFTSSKYGKPDDHIAMATITYVNETTPSAQAKIRLYGSTGNSVRSFDVKGRDNVSALQNDLTEFADQISADTDKLGAGARERIMELAQNINAFFAGLASRSPSDK